MFYDGWTAAEVGRRGKDIYESKLRPRVEIDNPGKFLVLDIISGEYEIADRDLTASERLLERIPKAIIFGVRIGHPTAYRLGVCHESFA
jgi:hypothetical protein